MRTIKLLQGFDTFTGSDKNTAITGKHDKAVPDQNSFTEICRTKQELHTSLSIDASASVAYAAYEVEGKAKFLKELDLTSESVTAVVYASKTATTGRPEDVAFKEEAAKLIKDEDGLLRFFSEYGDSWVTQLTAGREYLAAFVFKSQTRKEKEEVEASLRAKGVVGGATIQASFALAMKSAMESSKVEVVMRSHSSGVSSKTLPQCINPADLNDVIKFAAAFSGLDGADSDQPETVDLKVEGYEASFRKVSEFAYFKDHRTAFLGKGAGIIGLAAWIAQLTQVHQNYKAIKKVYDFYGLSFDVDLDRRYKLAMDDLEKLKDHVAKVSKGITTKPDPYTQPESIKWGLPELNAVFKLPNLDSLPKNLVGGGGQTFDDFASANYEPGQCVRLDSVQSYAKDSVHALISTIGTQYPRESSPRPHGAQEGTSHTLNLARGEFITSMDAWNFKNEHTWEGNELGGMILKTSMGNMLQTGPVNTGIANPPVNVSWSAKPNEVLVGFAGKAGSRINCAWPIVLTFSSAWEERSAPVTGAGANDTR